MTNTPLERAFEFLADLPADPSDLEQDEMVALVGYYLSLMTMESTVLAITQNLDPTSVRELVAALTGKP